MYLQDVNSLNKYLNGFIKRRQKQRIAPSLSTLFRNSRMKKYISSIGDFPILSHCLDIANQNGIIYTRQQLIYALNQSEDLSKESKKIKSQILNIWEEHQQIASHSSIQNAFKQSSKKGKQENGKGYPATRTDEKGMVFIRFGSTR